MNILKKNVLQQIITHPYFVILLYRKTGYIIHNTSAKIFFVEKYKKPGLKVIPSYVFSKILQYFIHSQLTRHTRSYKISYKKFTLLYYSHVILLVYVYRLCYPFPERFPTSIFVFIFRIWRILSTHGKGF